MVTWFDFTEVRHFMKHSSLKIVVVFKENYRSWLRFENHHFFEIKVVAELQLSKMDSNDNQNIDAMFS